MIITIDMGNSHTEIGGFEGETLVFAERIRTDLDRTAMEYGVLIHNIFEMLDIDSAIVTGGILSSVVPQLTETICRGVKKALGITPLVVGPGVKNGLKIAIDDPKQLGADMVVSAVGAIHAYGKPLIVIDMGTATTLAAIDDKGVFLGGLILSGMRTATNALSSGASQLPYISFTAPARVIGTNTIDSMKSGAVYGQAAQLDGLIDRIETEMGQNTTVVATGGLSGLVVPHCKRKDIIFDRELMLRGLRIIYEMNRKK
ncbi:MAG: type III pantothenate kinase [Lachnospiraceae bacterium]|nr:type III pantothenate kinase [Lachnospiraceae bacterium]